MVNYSKTDGQVETLYMTDSANIWKQYLGMDGKIVRDTILEKHKGEINTVQILTRYAMYTSDFRLDRIRLFVDAKNKVYKIQQR